MKSKLRLTAFASGVLGLCTSFSADAHLINLYYDSFGGFVQGTQQTTVSTTTVKFSGDRPSHDDQNQVLDDGNDAWTQVSWGDPTGSGGPFGGQSGLGLVGYNDGTVVTESTVLVPFGDLIHYNEPININTDSGSLTGIDVSWNLHLFPTLADAQSNDPTKAVLDWHQHFLLDTWETINSGTCPNSASAGTQVGTGVNGNPFISDGNSQSTCDDAFAFSAIPGQNNQFLYDNELYKVVVSGFYDGSGNLTNTFWSAEGSTNTGYVGFKVSAVPEPGSLALITLGLLGIGTVRCKAKNATREILA